MGSSTVREYIGTLMVIVGLEYGRRAKE